MSRRVNSVLTDLDRDALRAAELRCWFWERVSVSELPSLSLSSSPKPPFYLWCISDPFPKFLANQWQGSDRKHPLFHDVFVEIPRNTMKLAVSTWAPTSNVALGVGSSGLGMFQAACTRKFVDSILLRKKLGLLLFSLKSRISRYTCSFLHMPWPQEILFSRA